ncbi:MAG: lipocalin family protein [Lewinellaceae bacterium]|nr:lipocalin family protein [Lewinellaceae bacterium]
MRKIALLTFLWISALGLQAQYNSSAQPNFAGTFSGLFNGDPVTLTLQALGGGNYSGQMKDSQQTYQVQAALQDNQLIGTAAESTLGLTFGMQGTLQGAVLNLLMSIDVFGEVNTMEMQLTRQGAAPAAATAPRPASSGAPTKPAPGNRDPALVGSWVHQEIYNSGYGDNFMGANTYTEVTFNADGTVIDGGSRSTVSGSNYYGDTGQSQANVMPGVTWSTEGNQIYLTVTANGQTQKVHVGRYYIENGRLLLTEPNGNKKLFSRN